MKCVHSEVQSSPGTQRRGCCGATLDGRWSPRSSDSVNLVTMPCESEELRVHRFDAGETCDLCWNQDTSCGLSVVSGPCRTLELAVLTLDSGFGMPAELQVRPVHCPAFWLQQAIARRSSENREACGVSISAEVGTKAGSAAQKMRELLTRFGCHRSAGRADVAL